MSMNDHALFLFNAVLQKPEQSEKYESVTTNKNGIATTKPLESEPKPPLPNSELADRRHKLARQYGVLIESDALYAFQDIESFVHETRNPLDKMLNGTFYAEWDDIVGKAEIELLIDQLSHYSTGYVPSKVPVDMGREEEPLEKINEAVTKTLLIVKTISEKSAHDRALRLLCEKFARSAQTIDHAIALLDDLKVEWDEVFDKINNKEALVKVFPKVDLQCLSPVDFLRFLVFNATNHPLLIKSKAVLDSIASSHIDISAYCLEYSINDLASIFNRFKPIFMAFKKANPLNRPVINIISKRSKLHHKPMPANPIMEVTHRRLEEADLRRIERAPMPQLMRALQACKLASKPQFNFKYSIRNGSMWVKHGKRHETSMDVAATNFGVLKQVIRKRFANAGFNSEQTLYIPPDISYGLPVSEKDLIGSIPRGTTITRGQGEDMVVGICWREGYEAVDIDLSANSLENRVGWDRGYSYNGIVHSGDMIYLDADGFATECMLFRPLSSEKSESSYLVQINCYQGIIPFHFDVVVGRALKLPSENTENTKDPRASLEQIAKNSMLDPENIVCAGYKYQCTKRQCTLGLLRRIHDKTIFYLAPQATGTSSVASRGSVDEWMREAWFHEIEHGITLREFYVDVLGCKIQTKREYADIDLAPECLTPDSFAFLYV